MQIPNNGTFQAWTFEAKCKYQTTQHSKLEHLKQNANTKQRNIPSLNIWSKMQIPNNGTFQAWTFEAKCKILNNDLYRSMVWTKGTYRVLRVVHSLEERAPPAFARNLCDDVKRWVTKGSHYEELKISKVSRVCLKEQDFVCHKPFWSLHDRQNCMIKLHMQYTQKNALTTSNEKKFLNHTRNA
jgi:hypothetical protein